MSVHCTFAKFLKSALRVLLALPWVAWFGYLFLLRFSLVNGCRLPGALVVLSPILGRRILSGADLLPCSRFQKFSEPLKVVILQSSFKCAYSVSPKTDSSGQHSHNLFTGRLRVSRQSNQDSGTRQLSLSLGWVLNSWEYGPWKTSS